MTENETTHVERIPESGGCGEVHDSPIETGKIREKTGSHEEAEYQVFFGGGEETMIISACEEHIEEAKEWLENYD